VTDSYTYDVFGALRSQVGTSANPYRFTGELQDSQAARGLYYLRARYYDPALSRFLSRDPPSGFTGMPQSLNRYVYVYNNPTLLIDPYGYFGLGDVWNKAKEVGGDVIETGGDFVEATGEGIQAGAEWLGEDYHWAGVGATAGFAVAGAGVIVLTGGAATPLVVQVGAGIAISTGLATGGTLTAVSLKGPANECRGGSQSACAQFWGRTVSSGFGWVPPMNRFWLSMYGIRSILNYGPQALDWLRDQLQGTSGEGPGKE
jgi:RHS repeat-associated protein